MPFNLDPEANYLLVSVESNLALDVENASTERGARLLLQAITGNASQQWRIVQQEDGVYQIVNAKSNLLVTDHDGELVQDNRSYAPHQLWRLDPISGFQEEYQISEPERGVFLVPQDGQNGAQVRVGPVPPVWPPIARWHIRAS